MEIAGDYWIYLLIAVAIGAIVGFLLLRPRQRIRLSSDGPVRPHMAAAETPVSTRDEAIAAKPTHDTGIVAEAAAATRDVAGEIIGVPTRDVPDVADDFQRLKGVGPKFAQLLQARGFFRFDQLASLTAEEVARLDPELGPFRGRLKRDRIVEQATYLARGDQGGFEENFGKL